MPAPLHLKDVDDPHEAGRRVIFREFAEAIVRAACAKYGGVPIEKPAMPDDEENLLENAIDMNASMLATGEVCDTVALHSPPPGVSLKHERF